MTGGWQFWRRPRRRGLRVLLGRGGLGFARAWMARLPFSRFSRLGGWLFQGRETIRFHGVMLEVDPGERQQFIAYFLPELLNPEIETLQRLCRSQEVFVDVGGNMGWHSLAVAAACPAASVVLFEPEPGVRQRLVSNLRLNPEFASRITLVPAAVADRDGTARFCAPKPLNLGGGRVVSGDGEGEPVPVTRLDTYFANGRRPGVVKVDVEGGELRVLEGMRRLLGQGWPEGLLVEVHGFYFEDPAEAVATVWKVMREGDMSVYQLRHGRWEPAPSPPGACFRTHLLGVRGEMGRVLDDE